MTGRVKTFCPETGAGRIETEDGLTAMFEIADVLTYDRSRLKPGQVVSFVTGSQLPMRAYEIVVRSPIQESPGDPKAREQEDLRYTGFQNEDGARIYSFEERVAGEQTRQFRVVTEVDLLMEHRISFQETPSICLRLLQAKLAANLFPAKLKQVQCLLSAKDILAFVAAREAAMPRGHSRPRRTPRNRSSAFGANSAVQGSHPRVAGATSSPGRDAGFAYGSKGR